MCSTSTRVWTKTCSESVAEPRGIVDGIGYTVGGLNGRWYAGTGRGMKGAGGDGGGYSSEIDMRGEDVVDANELAVHRECEVVVSGAGEGGSYGVELIFCPIFSLPRLACRWSVVVAGLYAGKVGSSLKSKSESNFTGDNIGFENLWPTWDERVDNIMKGQNALGEAAVKRCRGVGDLLSKDLD